MGALLGCGGKSGPPVGDETGACYPNQTCNAGLTCLSELCVRVTSDAEAPAEDGATEAGAPADANSMNDGGYVTDGGPGTDAGPATDGGSGFQPAPHPRLPQLANLGGAVLTRPRVQPILYAADSNGADITAFLKALAGSSYWRATTAEYGVGALEILPPVTLASPPPATITDDMIQSEVAQNTAGPNAPWGTADPETVYLIVLPQGTLASFSNGATCCQDFGGYHYETQSGAMMVPYAVGCSCPGSFGSDLTTLQSRTYAISHELVEAATDPFPSTNPAFTGTDLPNYIWTYLTGGESTDLCALNPDVAYTLPGTAFVVSRSWSNAAAAAAQNPCVPVAATSPYFNSFPALDLIDYPTSGGTFPTRGLAIPLGQTRTIEITMYSAAPTAGKWSVSAFTFEDLFGGDRSNLALALDATEGKNGDRLHLSITPRRVNPTLGGEAFILVSQYGRSGDRDFQTNLSMALIRN